MTDRLSSKRRYTIHVPQLVQRLHEPSPNEDPKVALARTIRELDTMMSELQRFLHYAQDSSDDAVASGAFDPDVPEILDNSTGDPGDPGKGWSPGPHRHQVRTDPPVGLGNANATGTGPGLANADHVHKRDVRVQSEGADVAIRNALDFHDTGDVDFVITDEGAGPDGVKVEANLTASALIRPAPPLPHTHRADEVVSGGSSVQDSLDRLTLRRSAQPAPSTPSLDKLELRAVAPQPHTHSASEIRNGWLQLAYGSITFPSIVLGDKNGIGIWGTGSPFLWFSAGGAYMGIFSTAEFTIKQAATFGWANVGAAGADTTLGRPGVGTVRLSTPTGTDAELQVRAGSAQTTDLQQWQDKAGNVLSRIDKDGQSTDWVLAGQIFGS